MSLKKNQFKRDKKIPNKGLPVDKLLLFHPNSHMETNYKLVLEWI